MFYDFFTLKFNVQTVKIKLKKLIFFLKTPEKKDPDELNLLTTETLH